MGTQGSNTVQIDTVINAAGAVTGAQETTEALKQVAAATDEAHAAADSAGESLEKLSETTHSLQGEQLGSIRTARHLVESLIEISEGGPEAAAGVAMLTRVFTEMDEEALGALGPIVLIVSTLAAIGIPLLTKAFGNSKTEIKETADELKELTAATQEYVDEINQVLAAQEAVNKAQALELEGIREKQRLTAEQAKLDEHAAVEKLRQQYLVDEQNPALTGEQRARSKERFEAGVKDIGEQGTVNTAKQTVKDKEEDYNQQQKMEDTRVDQRRTDQQMIDDAMDLQTKARELIAGYGLAPGGKDGGTLVDADGVDQIAPLKAALEDAKEQLRKAQHPEVQNVGTAGAYVSAVDPADVARRQRDLQVAQGRYDDLTRAQHDYSAGDEAQKANQHKIDADDDAIKKGALELQTTLKEWLQAQVAVHQAQTDLGQDRTQAGIDQNKTDTDAAFATRQAGRGADRAKADAQLDNAALTPDQKAALKKQIEDIDVAGWADQLATYAKTLTDAQRVEIQGEIDAAGIKDTGIAATAGVKDARNATTAERRAQANATRADHAEAANDSTLIRDASSAIKSFGTPAEIAELKALVGKGKSGGSQGELVGVLRELLQVSAEHNNSVTAIIAEIQQQIQHLRDRTSYQNTN